MKPVVKPCLAAIGASWVYILLCLSLESRIILGHPPCMTGLHSVSIRMWFRDTYADLSHSAHMTMFRPTRFDQVAHSGGKHVFDLQISDMCPNLRTVSSHSPGTLVAWNRSWLTNTKGNHSSPVIPISYSSWLGPILTNDRDDYKILTQKLKLWSVNLELGELLRKAYEVRLEPIALLCFACLERKYCPQNAYCRGFVNVFTFSFAGAKNRTYCAHMTYWKFGPARGASKNTRSVTGACLDVLHASKQDRNVSHQRQILSSRWVRSWMLKVRKRDQRVVSRALLQLMALFVQLKCPALLFDWITLCITQMDGPEGLCVSTNTNGSSKQAESSRARPTENVARQETLYSAERRVGAPKTAHVTWLG